MKEDLATIGPKNKILPFTAKVLKKVTKYLSASTEISLQPLLFANSNFHYPWFPTFI